MRCLRCYYSHVVEMSPIGELKIDSNTGETISRKFDEVLNSLMAMSYYNLNKEIFTWNDHSGRKSRG